MKNGTADIVYRCKDCSKYNLCSYYYRRKETSQICHYFELPERKTGRWVVKGKKCVCSSCGSDDEYNLLDYRYCPWCGEKMEADE